MGLGLLTNILGMFGGAGEIGTTPLDSGVGYSPEIPMSTGMSTGEGIPAQPMDTTAGPSGSLWQQILNFTGLGGGGSSVTTDPNAEIDPKTGQPKDTKADDLAKFGKFLSAAGGAQAGLQNSRLAQQMIEQHVNQPQQQAKYVKPEDMATKLLMQAGLL